MSIETGRPAFPATVGELGVCEGMLLRDYFAAKAMGHHIEGASWCDLRDGADELASMAYTIADAMLKARGQ